LRLLQLRVDVGDAGIDAVDVGFVGELCRGERAFSLGFRPLGLADLVPPQRDLAPRVESSRMRRS